MSNDTEPIEVPATTASGAYTNPVEALKDVGGAFNDWSGVLTSTSLQMCYAIVAANWVIYGSINAILDSWWAILSLGSVLLALGANMVVAYWMAKLHLNQFRYAEDNLNVWKEEFDKHGSSSHPWPFTQTIETVGLYSRRLKVWLPVVGAVLLFIGACTKHNIEIHKYLPHPHYSLISS
jgi:hypothetical protein